MQTVTSPAESRRSSLRGVTKSRSGGHMAGLDVLRGVAILAVLIDHGLSGMGAEKFAGWQRAVVSLARYGGYGVTLFFVLSGFLITGLLLDNCESPHFYRNFYVRRALRILPAYLVTLILIRLFAHVSLPYIIVSLMFMSNMGSLFSVEAEYGPLWSLSVEEQFYLIWPWLVRRLSGRSFVRLCWVIVFGTAAVRLLVLFAGGIHRDIAHKMPYVTDAFAAGALVAVSIRAVWYSPKTGFTIGRILIATGLLAGVPMGLKGALSSSYIGYLAAFTLWPYILIFTGALILAVETPRIARGWIGRTLGFFGDISYGLYLIHQFVFDQYLMFTSGPDSGNFNGNLKLIAIKFAVCSAVAIGIAATSRWTMEAYFLGLKRHFA